MEKEKKVLSFGLLLISAGLIGAIEVSAFIFWTYLASFGETKAQVLFRSTPPYSIFWWSVPFGVLIGICISFVLFDVKKIGALDFSPIIVSCFLAIIIGFPTSFFITIVSAFGLPNTRMASTGWGFCIVFTLMCAIAIKFTDKQNSEETN